MPQFKAREIRRQLERYGCTIEMGSNHWKITHPSLNGFAIMSSNPAKVLRPWAVRNLEQWLGFSLEELEGRIAATKTRQPLRDLARLGLPERHKVLIESPIETGEKRTPLETLFTPVVQLVQEARTPRTTFMPSVQKEEVMPEPTQTIHLERKEPPLMIEREPLYTQPAPAAPIDGFYQLVNELASGRFASLRVKQLEDEKAGLELRLEEKEKQLQDIFTNASQALDSLKERQGLLDELTTLRDRVKQQDETIIVQQRRLQELREAAPAPIVAKVSKAPVPKGSTSLRFTEEHVREWYRQITTGGPIRAGYEILYDALWGWVHYAVQKGIPLPTGYQYGQTLKEWAKSHTEVEIVNAVFSRYAKVIK